MGSPFFARALYQIDRVTVTGQTARYPSSPTLERVFCPTCGTRLFAERLGAARMGIAVALFDDPDSLPPDAHMFTNYKVGWVHLTDGLPQHPEQPPDFVPATTTSP
jgi:hypothetical protein